MGRFYKRMTLVDGRKPPVYNVGLRATAGQHLGLLANQPTNYPISFCPAPGVVPPNVYGLPDLAPPTAFAAPG